MLKLGVIFSSLGISLIIAAVLISVLDDNVMHRSKEAMLNDLRQEWRMQCEEKNGLYFTLEPNQGVEVICIVDRKVEFFKSELKM